MKKILGAAFLMILFATPVIASDYRHHHHHHHSQHPASHQVQHH